MPSICYRTPYWLAQVKISTSTISLLVDAGNFDFDAFLNFSDHRLIEMMDQASFFEPLTENQKKQILELKKPGNYLDRETVDQLVKVIALKLIDRDIYNRLPAAGFCNVELNPIENPDLSRTEDKISEFVGIVISKY